MKAARREGFFGINYVGSIVLSSRNMHALGRPELECSLKIYVELYKYSCVSEKLSNSPHWECTLDCCSVCTSDCVG